jgi:hypothetical protein
VTARRNAWWYALVAAAGCGRIDFGNDPLGGIPDLVVRYPMDDDPSKGTITASRAEYDGHCSECPVAAAGQIGGAYRFDQTSYVVLPQPSAGLVGNTPYTVTVWVDAEIPMMHGTIAEKPVDPTPASDNIFKLYIGQGGAGVIYETEHPVKGVDALTWGNDITGAWHAIAARYDGATKYLFVDGALVGTETTPLATSDFAMQIGADDDSQNTIEHLYVGVMDDLRFYNRALSDGEIAELAR